MVASLAGGLVSNGIRPGAAVAWQLPNWHEGIVLVHACWRIGAVAVPLPHRLGIAEVAVALDVIAPAMTWSGPGLALAEEPGCLVVRGDARFADLLESSPQPVRPVHPSDLAGVIFTSGSTGVPKAVLHTHRGLAYKAFAQARVHRLAASGTVLMPRRSGT